MLEKLKFVWYWVMVFLFGKDGGISAGNSTHESTTWRAEVNGDVCSTFKEPSSVVVNEVVEKAKEVVDTLPVKKEEHVEETPVVAKKAVYILPDEENPTVAKEATSNRTGKKLLKDDDIRYIRKNEKVSKKELAAKFNVSEDTIRRIIKGDTYKDVK